MKINVHGRDVEATPENSAIFTGSTLLNGMYTDLDDDYVFIPEELDSYPELALTAKYESIPVYDIKCYDPTSPPFCFMINALCRMFREEVEIACGESGEC